MECPNYVGVTKNSSGSQGNGKDIVLTFLGLVSVNGVDLDASQIMIDLSPSTLDDSIHTYGVGLIISKEKANTLIEWDPISPRLIKAQFFSKYCKLTILQYCAPTNEADLEEKIDWYEQLQSVVS